jgi:hypothetical protein
VRVASSFGVSSVAESSVPFNTANAIVCVARSFATAIVSGLRKNSDFLTNGRLVAHEVLLCGSRFRPKLGTS